MGYIASLYNSGVGALQYLYLDLKKLQPEKKLKKEHETDLDLKNLSTRILKKMKQPEAVSRG